LIEATLEDSLFVSDFVLFIAGIVPSQFPQLFSPGFFFLLVVLFLGSFFYSFDDRFGRLNLAEEFFFIG